MFSQHLLTKNKCIRVRPRVVRPDQHILIRSCKWMCPPQMFPDEKFLIPLLTPLQPAHFSNSHNTSVEPVQ